MGRNFYAVSKKPSLTLPIHIGKSNVGWKFLFQGYNGIDSPLVIQNVEDWKEFLAREDKVIIDEYDTIISYDDFFALVEEKQSNDNPDNFSNAVNCNGYRFSYEDFN